MIYRLRYCNKDGVEARVDIQKGSSTPVIEVEGTERPFILSYNNDKGDKSGMFLSSSADIEIYETTDFNIDNLKTSNETELSVTHYINNVISWQGFIIPDFFSIEVRSNPVITMTASDRLGTLKNVTLDDLPTMVNIRALTLTCLSKTGLSLPLKTIADFSNDGTVNAFFSYYVDSQRIKDIKGRSISCYDILSSILIASNSKLVQRAGEWVIINKLQHEIGSGKIYSSLSSFTNYLENIYNFDEVSIGARRTIMPVAGSIGIYHEHGGRKSHPENYDFSLDLSGWNSVNGFVATIENRHIFGFLGGTPLFDTERTVKQYLLNYNNWIDDTNNLNTAPYITTDAIPINSPRADRVEVTVDISSIMAEKLSSNTAISFLRYAVILTNGVKTYTLTKAGIFEELDPENISGHSLLLRGGQQPPLLLASPALSNSELLKGLFEVGEDDNVNDYSASIRVYGSGNQYVTVNYALIKFSDVSELPKGTMYKTEQGEVFTKAYDIETSIFGDYLLSGLDGYFYRYPNDDTSSIYKDVNTLSTPVWTTPSIPNETSELPLLHHSMRQMRRMFSVAHNLLSAEIEASNFDPLAIFVACEKRYTVVSAQFDFFKSNLSVELEEVAFKDATVRDFIYSYFGDGEAGIKSIGGISGGTGGGGTGGGLTPEQIEILSFWKKDPDRENTIFTEMNAYSKLELSAYGAGDSGGGGGSDYERLDTWADYDSSRAGWVLSAFLGNDLNTRVTAIDGRVTDLENSAGSGSVTSVGISVPTGLSVSNSPITSSGVIAIGLQTGYSIPTTEKQGQWDGVVTDFDNLEIGGRNLAKESDIMSLGTNPTKGSDEYGNYIRFITNSPDLPRFTDITFEANTQYTLSIKASTETGSALFWRFHYTDGTDSGIYKFRADTTPPTTKVLTSAKNKTVDYLSYTWASGGFRRVYEFQIEKGTVPTDWSPAPEDQVSDWNTTDVNSFSFIKNKPTTLAGYGITDAYTKTEVNSALTLKLDKSVFDDLFEKVETSAGQWAVKVKYNLFSVGEISAFGAGESGSSGGGIIETVYGYGNLGQSFNNTTLTDTFNAYTINQINTRLVSVENGSALTVNTTGTGNAITSISKAGSVITANKGLTFSLSGHTHAISDITGLQTTLNSKLETSIFNTHNNDNVRHITGAERAKWDTVVTDFAELEIGGRNLWTNSRTTPATVTIGQYGYQSGTKNISELGLKTGELITFSVYVSNIPAGESVYARIDFRTGDGTYIPVTNTSRQVSIEGIIYVSTFVLDTSIYSSIRYRVMPVNYTADYQVDVVHEKLERGTIPTDWTPAPEDQVSDWNTTDVNSFSFIKNKPTLLSQFTDNIGVATHIANKANPHSVTTAQIGAVDLTTDQNIGGKKTFNTGIKVSQTGYEDFIIFERGASLWSFGMPSNNLVISNGDITDQSNRLITIGSNGNIRIGDYTANPLYKLDVAGTGGFTGNVTAPTFVGALNGNASTATALQTPRTIWGQSFDGTGNVTGALSGATTIAASISVASPKVIFNAAGWSMEQVGSELQMKHNNVLKMRFTSTGSIIATEEITAFG